MTYYLMVENNEIIGKSECTSGGDVIDIEVSKEIYDDFIYGDDKYIYRNEHIVLNPNYADIVHERERQEQIKLLKEQIEELDQKRIRAICEPSIKDEETGQTWLDYYNLQIQDLRNQISNL